MLRQLTLTSAALFVSALICGAQSTLVAVGATVTEPGGVVVGTVGSILAHAVTDQTDYMIHGILAGGSQSNDELLFGPDGVYLREGDAMPFPNPSNAVVVGFDGIEQDASGKLAYQVRASAANGSPAYEAIYFESTILLRTGISAEAAGFGSGSEFTDILAFRIARGATSCSARVLARVDVTIGSTVFESVVSMGVGCDALGFPERVISVGDLLCVDEACSSQTLPVVDIADSCDGISINASGETLVAVRLITANGIEGAVARGGVLDACDGCLLCGTAVESWGAVGETLALADNGQQAVSGTLASGVDVLVQDACGVAAQTGDTLPGMPGALTGVGRVTIVEDGMLYWYGTFTDPSPIGGSGIFRGNSVVVQRGVTTVGGSVVIGISNTPGSFYATGPSSLVAFRGSLANGLDGVFVVPTVAPNVQWAITPAPGCSGTNLATASLASGTSRIGDLFTLELDQAQVLGAIPQLFFANQPYELPFDPATACGYVWAYGESMLGLNRPNPVFGPIGAGWQPGLPSTLTLGAPIDALNLIGETWYVQALFFDPAGLSGSSEFVRTTNAVAVTFGSP